MWPHNLLQTNPCIRHNFSTQVFRKRAAQHHYVGPELRYIFWPPKEARKCSEAQGPHSDVVPRAFWRLVSISCEECMGSFARGCEGKRWSHWTCSSLWTIFQPMRINSVLKCFCNNKNVLCAQSMAWHFVRHPVSYHPSSCEAVLTNRTKNLSWILISGPGIEPKSSGIRIRAVANLLRRSAARWHMRVSWEVCLCFDQMVKLWLHFYR